MRKGALETTSTKGGNDRAFEGCNHGCSMLAHLGTPVMPNGARLSCGALKKNSFYNLRAPAASSAG